MFRGEHNSLAGRSVLPRSGRLVPDPDIPEVRPVRGRPDVRPRVGTGRADAAFPRPEHRRLPALAGRGVPGTTARVEIRSRDGDAFADRLCRDAIAGSARLRRHTADEENGRERHENRNQRIAHLNFLPLFA